MITVSPADMTFADKIKSERARLGLTQSEAVKLLGDISFEALSKWERGLTVPHEITQEGALARLRKMKGKK